MAKAQEGTKVPKDLSKLEDDELQKLSESLAEETLELRERNREVQKEVQNREAARQVAEQLRLDEIGDEELARLKQIVEAYGIKSEEAVGPKQTKGDKN